MEELSREDVELAAIARELRSAFAAHVEKKTNRKYKPNKRFESVETWKRVARVVQALGAVPEEYIRAQFLYSIGTVFANTLHGFPAQEKYKRFVKASGATKVAQPEEHTLSVDVAQLGESIHQAETMLQEQFGPKFVLTKDSIRIHKVKSEILASWWRFDPVVIMAYGEGDEDLYQKFFLPARSAVLESPHIVKAAANLGMDLSFLYTHDEDGFTEY